MIILKLDLLFGQKNMSHFKINGKRYHFQMFSEIVIASDFFLDSANTNIIVRKFKVFPKGKMAPR